MSNSRRLKRPISAVAASIFAFFVGVAFISSALAQSVNLENLLEAMSQDGAGGGILQPQGPGTILDKSRAAGARSIGMPIDGPVKTRIRDKLTQRELVQARRFCEGKPPLFLKGSPESSLPEGLVAFSAIERDYCVRARMLMLQFGYEIFDGLNGQTPLINGAIQDSYVLGPGDELIVSFRGQERQTLVVKVDREGRVILPSLRPVQAGGRTFGGFRSALEAATDDAFIGTDVFVSLGAVRVASVLVLGEVKTPGVHLVTGLSTVMDALGRAGGVTKTGSLRQVQVIRQGSQTTVDFYDLLYGRSMIADFTLREGDRILVPPIGPTIAVGGDVKRPGIYELTNERVLQAGEAVALAGGLIRPVGNSYAALRLGDDGVETIFEARQPSVELQTGDLLIVRREQNAQVGGVHLSGHVRIPGRRGLTAAPTIGALVGRSANLKRDPYLPLAILETADPTSEATRLFAINLLDILAGKVDYRLAEGDHLIVLSGADVDYLAHPGLQNTLRGAVTTELTNENSELSPPTSLQSIIHRVQAERGTTDLAAEAGRLPGPGVNFNQSICPSIRHLETLISNSKGRFSNAVVSFHSFQSSAINSGLNECRQVYEANPEILPFVLEHSVKVTGEVRRPGPYPVADGTTLDAVVSVAGGLTLDVDRANVEFTQPQNNSGQSRSNIDINAQPLVAVPVAPGDSIQFNAKFTGLEAGPVLLAGEFMHPGTFTIRRGERLSSLVARAGGLTAQAYPFGAVFTRESVRRAEKASLRRLARELNAAVTVAAASRSIDPSAITAFAQLTRDVSEAPATGRVVIEADPTVLDVRPELDVVLQPGDRLFMPKRPSSVLVTGDVLNPGAMQFVSGATVESYIRKAGGFQSSADQGRIFVVLPNGAAQPTAVSPFRFTKLNVPPGSTVVIPKDATPFDLLRFAGEISTVLGQLAVTAASLAVISDN